MSHADGVALVTGGAGFIGSHLVRALLERGRRVRVADDLSTGRKENLAEVLDRLEFVQADLCDVAATDALFHDVTGVFHLAGDYSVPRSLADPVRINAVNASAAVNVLWGAVRHRAGRVVIASSCTVYGDGDAESDAADLVPSSLSPYAVSKTVAELYARTFGANFGLETVVLRYFNVYGARQSADPEFGAAVPRFVHALLRAEHPEVYGDGKQTRDFIHVDDVVRATLLAVERPGAAGKAYNIAGGRPVTVLELLHAIAEELGTAGGPRFRPPRPGERRHCSPDVSAAERDLGFRAQVDLHEGIRRTIPWYRLQLEGTRCASS